MFRLEVGQGDVDVGFGRCECGRVDEGRGMVG